MISDSGRRKKEEDLMKLLPACISGRLIPGMRDYIIYVHICIYTCVCVYVYTHIYKLLKGILSGCTWALSRSHLFLWPWRYGPVGRFRAELSMDCRHLPISLAPCYLQPQLHSVHLAKWSALIEKLSLLLKPLVLAREESYTFWRVVLGCGTNS